MSVSFQISSFALSPVAVSPARDLRASFAPVVALVRAALQQVVAPSYAERHAKDVDIVSVSRWNGHGRNSVSWNDIGYRI